MAMYLHPGIFIEEYRTPSNVSFDGGWQPSQAEVSDVRSPRVTAEQSVTGFVGLASEGPFDTPVLVSDWDQYVDRFGDFSADTELAGAVWGFFQNGGRLCYVVRIREPTAASFVGDAADRSGLCGFDATAEISAVCMPDLAGAVNRGLLDLESLQAAQLGTIAQCEQMWGRIAILDPPPGLSVQQLGEWRRDIARYDSRFAALYYPWIKTFNPALGTTAMTPPSGHVAGVYARSDLLRGFHRSPAGLPIAGVVDLQNYLTDAELDYLHPLGVNTVVSSPGRGILMWGARTLSSDPDRRRLRTQRTLNVLYRAIRSTLGWAVFETASDVALWDRIAVELRGLLHLFWRSGAVTGDIPEEAFEVMCDAKTNTLEDVDAGRVTAEAQATLDQVAVSFRVICQTG